MACVRLLQLAVVASVAHVHVSDNINYLMVEPQDPAVQIGMNFTATCFIRNTAAVTADDLSWKLQREAIPKEQYTRVNTTALRVTFTVTEEMPGWLFCSARKDSEHVILNAGKYQHGIKLKKGYFPEKPKNLSCNATQAGAEISPFIHCQWEPPLLEHFHFVTTYTLNLHVDGLPPKKQTTQRNSAKIDTDVFPNFMPLDIWVEAENELGAVESEHLKMEANSLVKTDPPSHVNIISEDSFPTSLLLNWTRPIHQTKIKLIYEIRYAPNVSHTWVNVPQEDTKFDIQSFRLQSLRPDTVYVAQVRCKNWQDGYWSEWSSEATKMTPESKPSSKPNVWHILTENMAAGSRQVQLQSKEPEFANGVILEYHMRIQECKDQCLAPNFKLDTVPALEADRGSKAITLLKEVHLSDRMNLCVKVSAINSKGESPEASLMIPVRGKDRAPVQKLEVSSDGETLSVGWSAPYNTNISEFVVQWTNGVYLDWQREKKTKRNTTIRGNLEKFVRYNVSVYPLYSLGWIGKPAHVLVYLEQGVPLEGPTKIISTPGCEDAHLKWEEIPLKNQKGFITNYTISYSDGTKRQEVTVSGNTLSYTLTHLQRNTRYNVLIRASTIRGGKDGVSHSFTTLKYGPGEIEGIVVGVSLCFLFVVVLTMLICICKRDTIKKSLWPEIPNPGESTIGSWSPDYPLKAETPTENGLSGISVLDVDVCDGKSVFEEDKSCLPLKKDKYLSEEHSSGIGGSSCMSSPRQSVSDSDEGGDMADTTASTVQYSSVVASSGYKGQTPSLQPQQAVFSRSESTQPLLECEENPDMLSLEGSRQSQRVPHFSPNQLEMEAKTLDFCSVEEDCEEMTSADDQPEGWLASGPSSSYMPQLGGYRPQ